MLRLLAVFVASASADITASVSEKLLEDGFSYAVAKGCNAWRMNEARNSNIADFLRDKPSENYGIYGQCVLTWIQEYHYPLTLYLVKVFFYVVHTHNEYLSINLSYK